MAIISLSASRDDPRPTICAICDVQLTPDKATAGLLDASSNQTFACVSHFSELEKLILGWADFTANQRRIYLNQGIEPQGLIYGMGGDDARLAY